MHRSHPAHRRDGDASEAPEPEPATARDVPPPWLRDVVEHRIVPSLLDAGSAARRRPARPEPTAAELDALVGRLLADDATGCLELVAGTHTGPWLMPRTFMTGEARWFPDGTLAELPDIEADRAAFDIKHWELAPGDAICFDFLTVHGAPGFPFAGRRRVLSLRYLADDARHAPRRWKTSPDFPGLAEQLPAGAELDHPLFPLIVDELR